jgi:hypothetical protein
VVVVVVLPLLLLVVLLLLVLVLSLLLQALEHWCTLQVLQWAALAALQVPVARTPSSTAAMLIPWPGWWLRAC